MSLAAALAVLVLSVSLQALFVGAEMALTSIDRDRLERALASGRGGRSHKAVLSFLQEPTWILGTTLLGSNLALATTATVIVSLTWSRLGLHALWLVGLLVPFTVLVGNILPKSWFQAHPMAWALRLIWPLRLLSWPLRLPLAGLAILSRFLVGHDAGTQRRPFVLREELKLRIQDHTSTPELGAMEREMITRIFDFRHTTVEDVMVPLINVQGVDEGRPLLEAVEALVEAGYSRLTIYRGRVDNVVGILYAFDLLYEKDLDQPIKRFVRKAYYIPRNMPISRLFVELRRRRQAMAVVVDEYGGAQGIVTLEDVLEEIVGEIEDEYDQRHTLWRKTGPSEYLVDARLDLKQLQELTGVELPTGDYETVAGFLLSTFGRIPQSGELTRFGNLTFVVRKSTERAIREVTLIQRAGRPPEGGS